MQATFNKGSLDPFLKTGEMTHSYGKRVIVNLFCTNSLYIFVIACL